MLYLLDTNQDYDEAARELMVSPEDVGQLITPLTRYSNRWRDAFAIDNGAYKRFDDRAFVSLLEREKPNRSRCLFVAVPDVVGSARRTREVFRYWYANRCADLMGWPLAYVCQDGQENIEIPWDEIEAIFIGGTDSWKLSGHAEACCKAARAMGKHVHVGRINSGIRLNILDEWPVDSVDGSGISRYTHMRASLAACRDHPKLEGVTP